MATTSDLKKRMKLELEGEPYTVVDVTSQSPSARGGATLVKTKLRNMKTKQLIAKTFKAGERIKEPDCEIRKCQYLYSENGELYYFMDQESYEQFSLNKEDIEYELGFIRENDEVKMLFHDGSCFGLEVPNTVILEVVNTEPAVKGDTVNNVTKAATLETGLEVQVPLFVEQGQKLVIDTRDCRYLRRG